MASYLSESTSHSLINRVALRDEMAWRQFAELYTPLVYRWARQCGVQTSDAADLVQEVFTAVARNIDRFRHDRPDSTLRGWLWTITRNQVRLFYRRGKVRPTAIGGSDAHHFFHQHPAQDSSWSDLVEQAEEPAGFDSHTSLVHRAVQVIRGDFQPHTWQVFWSVVVEGRSLGEVAEQFGLTLNAARQAKFRVLCRLQNELDRS
jgi:RNA polymerase sigma-70 factor (ECF subfamily)